MARDDQPRSRLERSYCDAQSTAQRAAPSPIRAADGNVAWRSLASARSGRSCRYPKLARLRKTWLSLPTIRTALSLRYRQQHPNLSRGYRITSGARRTVNLVTAAAAVIGCRAARIVRHHAAARPLPIAIRATARHRQCVVLDAMPWHALRRPA